MLLAQVLMLALAMWGYSGLPIVGTIGKPPATLDQSTVEWAYPSNGVCYVGFNEERWAVWPDHVKVLVAAHGIGHCLHVPHNDHPGSLMTPGIGETIMEADWIAAKAVRDGVLAHRVTVAGLAQ